jgi:hypothetical protein
VPYTTYVGNLLAKRVELELKKETKIISGQKIKISIDPLILNFNFEKSNVEIQKETKMVDGEKKEISIENLILNFQKLDDKLNLKPLSEVKINKGTKIVNDKKQQILIIYPPIVNHQEKEGNFNLKPSEVKIQKDTKIVNGHKIEIRVYPPFEVKIQKENKNGQSLEVEIQKETKIVNGQKIEIRIHPPKLNDLEKKGNFDLKVLETKWIKAHNSSVDVSKMLPGSTEFNNPVGTFSFSKPEIVLIYPAAVSILLIYLSLHFYDLLNLKQKLKDEDEELVKIPVWRISIASISLLLCLACSLVIIRLPPQIPRGNTSHLVTIESRLGKIIAKESSYQITSDIDLWIFFLSLILFDISGVVTVKACLIKK